MNTNAGEEIRNEEMNNVVGGADGGVGERPENCCMCGLPIHKIEAYRIISGNRLVCTSCEKKYMYKGIPK